MLDFLLIRELHIQPSELDNMPNSRVVFYSQLIELLAKDQRTKQRRADQKRQVS